MDKDYESLYHNEEETNWWFVARRDMLFRFFDKYKIPKSARILDIGCAGAVLLLQLKKMGYENVYALDYSAEAIELAKKNGIEHAYEMDGHNPEFPAETFDVIISSDSMEHLERDEVALSNWHKILKKDGIGFILVPAYQFLWSEHDEINYHYRRYTKNNLRNKVTKAGFSILYSGYNYALIFLPTALFRLTLNLFKKKKKEEKDGQILMLPKWVNTLLIQFQKLENSISKNISLPFGVSTFVVVRK